MFRATTARKAATVTCYVINTIVLVFCLGRKQCNEDKQYKQNNIIIFTYSTNYYYKLLIY